jgi:ATP synthase F1 delta subunit
VNYKANDLLVAKKYAQAFIRVSGNGLSFSDITNMEKARLFLSHRRRILFFLQLNQFSDKEKEGIITDFMGYFSLPESLSSLISLLIQHNRSSFIPTVFFFIVELYRQKHKIVHFVVKSYPALAENKKQPIKDFLAHSLNESVTCSFETDKNLIAGVAARSVDYMWEHSVRRQLKSLRALSK